MFPKSSVSVAFGVVAVPLYKPALARDVCCGRKDSRPWLFLVLQGTNMTGFQTASVGRSIEAQPPGGPTA